MIAAPPADRDCVADGLFEGAPVWQSGKNVVVGEVAELRRGAVDARLHLAVDLVEGIGHVVEAAFELTKFAARAFVDACCGAALGHRIDGAGERHDGFADRSGDPVGEPGGKGEIEQQQAGVGEQQVLLALGERCEVELHIDPADHLGRRARAAGASSSSPRSTGDRMTGAMKPIARSIGVVGVGACAARSWSSEGRVRGR